MCTTAVCRRLSLLSLVLCVRHGAMRCVHDDLPLQAARPTVIQYADYQRNDPAGVRRAERSVQETDTSMQERNYTSVQEGNYTEVQEGNYTSMQEKEHQFKPLRIHTHFLHSASLSQDVYNLLKEAVERSVQRVSRVLAVVPVPGPLLLNRTDDCHFVLAGGINKGKCSRLKKRLKGEFCLDVFRIPHEHLAELHLYNSTSPEPVRTLFKTGAGVEAADVILYVVSRATRLCLAQNQSVMAYASHCHVDQTGRPISGLVNFCPYGLMRQTPSPQSLYATALHEILHVLGFSFKLFKTFKKCQGEVCETFRDPVRTVRGQDRLVLPAVVNATRRHFKCHIEDDFGGPLDKRTNRVTSHWDSRWMHTSLMTAEDDHTPSALLDPLTLAVFQDSGWYQVNVSQGDPFLWGKGGGCWFALPGYCHSFRTLFCWGRSSGCHFLLRDKAKCDAGMDDCGYGCGVYASVPQGSCTHFTSRQTTLLEFPEVISPSSRCFLSTITANTLQLTAGADFVGRCYERRCADDGTLSVRADGTNWTPCPLGETIQVSVSGVHGEIQCPTSTEIVCQKDTPLYLMPTSTPKPPEAAGPVTQRTTPVDGGHLLTTETARDAGHRPGHNSGLSGVSSEGTGCLWGLVLCWFCQFVW